MDFELGEIPLQDGRVAIVTGANTGLGFEVAIDLARKSMTVILACRDPARANAAKSRIQQIVAAAKVEVMLLDLSCLESVRQFAVEFLATHQRLDLLINNAGIMIPPFSLTEDGFESQFGINYLGHFLLTGLLLDSLEATPGSRTVSVASLAHRSGRIDFDDLRGEKHYFAWAAYARSKLACLIFAYEMQRRLEYRDYQTIAVAAHPGVSSSDLSRHLPRLVNRVVAPVVLKISGQSAAQGALPILCAALADDVSGGDYIGPQSRREWKGQPRRVTSSWRSRNLEVAVRLWKLSQQWTGIEYLDI